MLGDFFVQTITNGGIDTNEETLTQNKLKEDAFVQSGEVVCFLYYTCFLTIKCSFS